jgi:hypothetical protein
VTTDDSTSPPLGPDGRMSVAAAHKYMGLSAPVLRRMFDEHLPESGVVIEEGRTGGRERRIDPVWAAKMRAVVADRRARGRAYARPEPQERGEHRSPRRGAVGQQEGQSSPGRMAAPLVA